MKDIKGVLKQNQKPIHSAKVSKKNKIHAIIWVVNEITNPGPKKHSHTNFVLTVVTVGPSL